jgi:DNA-binding transcriptional LysR family regulator
LAGRVNPPVSDIDLKALRVFKAVVDNGGFAASEVALNKSKSAISLDIGHLERRFGMRLCERGRSGFALTAQGETVYQAASALFEDLDRFSAQVAATSSQLFGHVTLAVIDNIGSVAADPMVAAIRDYRARHPQVQLSIQSGSATETERAVLDRTAHVGLSTLPRPLPELEAAPLFVESQLLYCGRAHPLFSVDDGQLTPERIAEHPISSLPMDNPATNPSLGALRRGAKADNLDCLILVILAGVDLGFLPPHYARRWVEAGEVRAIRPDLYHVRHTFYLISLKPAKLAPISRELLKTLSQAFEAHPVDGQAFVTGNLKPTCDD